MDKVNFLFQLQRKKRIASLVDSVIKAKIEHVPRKLQKERVGAVQNLIINLLKIEPNPETKQFISKRMEANGFKRIIRMGKYYYQNAKLKDSNEPQK